MGYESEIKKLEVRWEDNPKQYFAPLADAYRKNGDYPKAIQLITDGLAERPNYVSAYIVLGRTRVGMEEYDDAARVFEQVLEFDGENIIALSQLAELSEKMDDLAGAIRWLRRLLEVDPMNQAAARLGQLEAAGGTATAGETDETQPATGAADVAEGVSFAGLMDGDSEEPAQETPDPAAETPAEQPETPGTEDSQPVEENAVQDPGVEKEQVPDPGPEVREMRPALDEVETVVDMAAVDLTGAELGDDAREDSPLELVEDSTDAVQFIEPAAPSGEAIADDEPEETEVPAEEPAAEQEDEGEPAVADGASGLSSSLESIPVIIPEEVDEGEFPGISRGVDEPSPEPVVTETMANVFAQQGMVDQARQVYEQLLESQPENEKLRAKLEKLGSMRPSTSPTPPRRGPRCSVVDTGGKSSRAFLQGILSTVVNSETAVTERAKPFDGPDESATPRSRLSFDDFYGAAMVDEPVAEAADQRPADDDFKDWLKGLKS